MPWQSKNTVTVNKDVILSDSSNPHSDLVSGNAKAVVASKLVRPTRRRHWGGKVGSWGRGRSWVGVRVGVGIRGSGSLHRISFDRHAVVTVVAKEEGGEVRWGVEG